MIIEMPTLLAGTCTSSRVITYKLDSSSWIHGVNHLEKTVEYHSDHRDSYTPCRHILKEYRVITYLLGSSKHGAKHVEERVEYHNQ